MNYEIFELTQSSHPPKLQSLYQQRYNPKISNLVYKSSLQGDKSVKSANICDLTAMQTCLTQAYILVVPNAQSTPSSGNKGEYGKKRKGTGERKQLVPHLPANAPNKFEHSTSPSSWCASGCRRRNGSFISHYYVLRTRVLKDVIFSSG